MTAVEPLSGFVHVAEPVRNCRASTLTFVSHTFATRPPDLPTDFRPSPRRIA